VQRAIAAQQQSLGQAREATGSALDEARSRYQEAGAAASFADEQAARASRMYEQGLVPTPSGAQAHAAEERVPNLPAGLQHGLPGSSRARSSASRPPVWSCPPRAGRCPGPGASRVREDDPKLARPRSHPELPNPARGPGHPHQQHPAAQGRLGRAVRIDHSPHGGSAASPRPRRPPTPATDESATSPYSRRELPLSAFRLTAAPFPRQPVRLAREVDGSGSPRWFGWKPHSGLGVECSSRSRAGGAPPLRPLRLSLGTETRQLLGDTFCWRRWCSCSCPPTASPHRAARRRVRLRTSAVATASAIRVRTA